MKDWITAAQSGVREHVDIDFTQNYREQILNKYKTRNGLTSGTP